MVPHIARQGEHIGTGIVESFLEVLWFAKDRDFWLAIRLEIGTEIRCEVGDPQRI